MRRAMAGGECRCSAGHFSVHPKHLALGSALKQEAARAGLYSSEQGAVIIVLRQLESGDILASMHNLAHSLNNVGLRVRNLPEPLAATLIYSAKSSGRFRGRVQSGPTRRTG